MGFLIVGHTHASIDQYFSCLRKRIKRAIFIASPPALHHLFQYKLSNSAKLKSVFRPPLVQIQIYFIRNYKEAFAPYYNKKITNYGIPYGYEFSLLCGKCIVRYRMFNMPLQSQWYPLSPLGYPTSLEQVLNTNFPHFEVK